RAPLGLGRPEMALREEREVPGDVRPCEDRDDPGEEDGRGRGEEAPAGTVDCRLSTVDWTQPFRPREADLPAAFFAFDAGFLAPAAGFFGFAAACGAAFGAGLDFPAAAPEAAFSAAPAFARALLRAAAAASFFWRARSWASLSAWVTRTESSWSLTTSACG